MITFRFPISMGIVAGLYSDEGKQGGYCDRLGEEIS